MADATHFPSLLQLALARPGAARPQLARALGDDSSSDTTVYLNNAINNEDGSVPTEAFILVVKKRNGANAGATERIYCPANSIAADGLSITGVTRGIEPGGLDYTTTNESFVLSFDAEDPVYIALTGIQANMLQSALQGVIGTGGNILILGDETSDTLTLSGLNSSSNTVGLIRRNATNVQYSDNGTDWVNISDTSGGTTVKVSANDTTAGYLEQKITGAGSVTVSVLNDGGDEDLVITGGAQRDGVTTHATYTPAYMTGGSSAETTIALWDSVTDGSFRITIDGTAYNVDAIDFSATHPDGIVTNMSEVAERIQSSLRALTSSTETVVWSTDHFVITSVDTTVSSEVTVTSTSTGTVGTDISGAGAGTWMDSETGRGTATAAVINASADTGKVPLLNANGNVDTDLLQEVIPSGGYTAKGEMIAASGADTPTLISVGSDGNVLTADSTETGGVVFKAPPALGGRGGGYYSFPIDLTKLSGTATTFAYSDSSTTEPDGDAATLTNLTLMYANGATVSDLIFEWVGRFTHSGVVAHDARLGFAGSLADLQTAYNAVNGFVGFAAELDASGTYHLYAVTADGATATTTSIDSAVDESNLYIHRIEYTPSEVKFYINNVLVATHTTNILALDGSDSFGLGHGSSATGNNHGGIIRNAIVHVAITDL